MHGGDSLKAIPLERIRARRSAPGDGRRFPDARSKALSFLETLEPHLKGMERMMDGIDSVFAQELEDSSDCAGFLGSVRVWTDWHSRREPDRQGIQSWAEAILRECRIHMRIEDGRRRTRPRRDASQEQIALGKGLNRAAAVLEAFLAYWRTIEVLVRKVGEDDSLSEWMDRLEWTPRKQ
jgi:hypothetical protein